MDELVLHLEDAHSHQGSGWLWALTTNARAPGEAPHSILHPHSILRPHSISLANKGLSSHSYGFSSAHVWMRELDHKEG